MLSKEEAERLAAQMLAAERGPRRPPLRRRAWFMGLWRQVCRLFCWGRAYIWLMRRELRRRLPEALAAGVEVGEV